MNPAWLLDHLGLPADDVLFQGVGSSETGALTQPPRIHSTFNFVQGRVCIPCNTGWMCRLESAVKPILAPLMERERLVESLSSSEAATVSKWAVKTAYMHSWTSPLRQPVELAHLTALLGDTGTPRTGVGVFAMQADFKKPSSYFQTGHWPQLALPSAAPAAETPKDAYKLGLQFRNLYLLIAFWPDATSLLTPVRGMHRRLFPPSDGSDPDYSPDLSIGEGPVDRLAVFSNWLAVWHL